jgi:hypothetical protein
MMGSFDATADNPVPMKVSSAMFVVVSFEFVVAEFAGLVTSSPLLHSTSALNRFHLITSLMGIAVPWILVLTGQRALARQAGLFKEVSEQPTLVRFWNICLTMASSAHVIFFAGLSLGSAGLP